VPRTEASGVNYSKLPTELEKEQIAQEITTLAVLTNSQQIAAKLCHPKQPRPAAFFTRFF